MSVRRSAQSGVALMLVLWVIALLTIIAVALTAAQRTESTLAGNQLAAARFRAVAEAGVSFAVLNLLATPPVLDDEVDLWAPDGAARLWTFGGETVEIRVFNEASRIDLNKAPKDLLVALTAALELPEDESSALADAIEDWRDTDDLTQLNGAEDGDYEDAGRSYGAKDGPFDSVEELQQVLGVDSRLYRLLASVLTVDSDTDKVDEEFADPLVHAALQGITLEEAELELQEREALLEAGFEEAVSISRGGPLYRIRVTRLVDGKPGPGMEALVRVEQRGTPPFSVLWRRFGLVAQPASTPAVEGG